MSEPTAGLHADPDAVELHILRGRGGGPARDVVYRVPLVPGMVVLDALHHVQRTMASDLACRWNCKAAKCGSCGAEVNGRPVLLCKTRLDSLPPGPVRVGPLRAFPLIKDLVTDVSPAFGVEREITPFSPRSGDAAPWRMEAIDVERVHELRRCIECFLCQDVCHVLRDHHLGGRFWGPRHFARVAALELHPHDAADRTAALARVGGLGYCNITRCCTEVCPEHIRITDNAIIPLKERVADHRWDPLRSALRVAARRWRRRRNGTFGQP